MSFAHVIVTGTRLTVFEVTDDALSVREGDVKTRSGTLLDETAYLKTSERNTRFAKDAEVTGTEVLNEAMIEHIDEYSLPEDKDKMFRGVFKHFRRVLYRFFFVCANLTRTCVNLARFRQVL